MAIQNNKPSILALLVASVFIAGCMTTYSWQDGTQFMAQFMASFLDGVRHDNTVDVNILVFGPLALFVTLVIVLSVAREMLITRGRPVKSDQATSSIVKPLGGYVVIYDHRIPPDLDVDEYIGYFDTPNEARNRFGEVLGKLSNIHNARLCLVVEHIKPKKSD